MCYNIMYVYYLVFAPIAVTVKVCNTHANAWLLKDYSQHILAYYTRILLLDIMYGRIMVNSKAYPGCSIK